MISTTANAPDDPLRDGGSLSGRGVVADGPLLVGPPMLTIENGPTVIFVVIAALLLAHILYPSREKDRSDS
jgi:hypothetical protein